MRRFRREEVKAMTLLQKAVLRSGHPRRVIVGVVSLIWVLYFLWFHNWVWAVTVLAVGVVMGATATLGMHEDQLAQTTLGKILLLHLHPVNMVLQGTGVVLLFYSAWAHSGVGILAAVSLILLGHLRGWHRVNEAF
jgi:hypothetical protein